MPYHAIQKHFEHRLTYNNLPSIRLIKINKKPNPIIFVFKIQNITIIHPNKKKNKIIQKQTNKKLNPNDYQQTARVQYQMSADFQPDTSK